MHILFLDDWNEPWRNWGTTVQAEETASDKHFDQHHICTILETICYAMHQSEKTAAFAGVFQFLDASLTDGPFRFGDVGLVGGLIKANGAYECPHLNSIC